MQARMGSTRLPGKSLAELGGKPLVHWPMDALLKSFPDADLYLATSTNSIDDPLAEYFEDWPVKVFRGDEDDVRSRFIGIARRENAQIMIRVTGDNPLVEPRAIARCLLRLVTCRAAYCRMDGLPLGAGGEVFSARALFDSESRFEDQTSREHVTLPLYRNDELFRADILEAPPEWRAPQIRLTVDQPEDLEMMRGLFKLTPGRRPLLEEAIRFIGERPEIGLLNSDVEQLKP